MWGWLARYSGKPMTAASIEILRRAGFDVEGASAQALTGGISCTTDRVHLRDRDVVVKQALSRLHVEADWQSDPHRAVAEGVALEWLHRCTPDAVPAPLAILDEPPAVVIPMAPEPCPDWRVRLLQDPSSRDIEVARSLRSIVHTWHNADVSDARGTVLDDLDRVTELRITPFYLGMAERWPECAEPITMAAHELMIQTVMTHGDFTPKNVLCLPEGLWVIDAEITHIGNPILDIASMTTHLLLKSIVHRQDPAKADVMRAVRQAFGTPAFDGMPTLSVHVGVFLGVRCAGISPARYLTDEDRKVVESMSRSLLAGASLAEVERDVLSDA